MSYLESPLSVILFLENRFKIGLELTEWFNFKDKKIKSPNFMKLRAVDERIIISTSKAHFEQKIFSWPLKSISFKCQIGILMKSDVLLKFIKIGITLLLKIPH